MKYGPLIKGISTYFPGLDRFRSKNTGGTDSARYCYSVWLRHLVMARDNGLNPYPKMVAELGPGDSLGIGLAALISGCDRYFAFDVVEYANAKRNLEIFDTLLKLFKDRAAIPGEDEFPEVKPHLDEYHFPCDILNESKLQDALRGPRIERIRNSVIDLQRKDSLIRYKVPWNDAKVLEEESVDLIYSQAVLEHVDDLADTYDSMRLWLKPNGYISHQIDFKCHETAHEWNGHWEYSDFIWKLIRGKYPFLLNREPHSTHIAILNERGFDVICDRTFKSESNLTADDLAPRFRSITDDDMTTSGAFIQAMKIS